MTNIGMLQMVIYVVVILLFVKPLGWYIARVYCGKPCGLNQIGAPLERFIYRLCGIYPKEGMGWIHYLSAMLCFNALGFFAIYAIQRAQYYLPLNPEHMTAPSAALAFNTAVSFITNTNWQAYGGETTLSYFSQMVGLTVQNFLSAATGMSLLIALIRGLTRHESKSLGNFWVDTVRGVLYILLPLSLLLALALTSEGVIQTLKPYQTIELLAPQHTTNQTTQTLPMGPVASQVAIKQLGTNGGGFFNANSMHPFENPTPLTNFLEMLALLLIPASLCYTFGIMINDKRQGWALLTAMFLMLIPLMTITMMAETAGNSALTSMGVEPTGNMEGKETRFGIASSAIWAVATTASSNGSVNAALDSFTPLGGLIPLWMMHLGEVIFGGVGSGLYGMIMFVIITVFVAGLMVGRTPEYLGKKIEPFEMKMASLVVLIMPLVVLITTAVAAITPMGIDSINNPGAHGFTEILYAFTSMANNNGSAFSGLNANTPFYTIVGGFVMLIGRYWLAIPAIALAGSLVKKKRLPSSPGTLATHTPLFILLLITIIILIGALSFLPALALGPIVEQLTLWKQHGY